MLNLGIIGYGVRMDMLMDPLFSLGKEVRIKAVADFNPERAKALMTKNVEKAKWYGMELDKIDANLRECPMDPESITWYADCEEMMDREQLDGVMIGTNCNTHAALAKKVLDRNIPLFLEKPVGVCQEDLDLLKACDAKNHAPVVVSFPLRATNLVVEVKKLLDAGVIGKVDHVQAFNDVPYGFVYFHDWYRNESISHGLFLQKATHDVDVLNFLIGETPKTVCAMKSKQIFKGDMPAGLRCSQCDKQFTCMESSYNIINARNDTPPQRLLLLRGGHRQRGLRLPDPPIRERHARHLRPEFLCPEGCGPARRPALRLQGHAGIQFCHGANHNLRPYERQGHADLCAHPRQGTRRRRHGADEKFCGAVRRQHR